MAENTLATRAAASPGLYGRACKSCATAKARCVASTDSNPKCQRCQRLGKLCEPSAAAQRRKSDKKIGRVAKLEEKLDSLVMLLNNASNKALVAEPEGQPSAMPTPLSSSSSSSAVETAQNSISQNSHPIGDVGNLGMNYGTSVHSLLEQVHVSVPPSTRTAFQELNEQRFERSNILLDRFREMTVYFPFIIVPPTVDAKTLFEERPFLYRTIMAAAEQNPVEQKDQVRSIMQYIALHVLQLGEKNLDILLGVLVHTAWSHFHIHTMPRLTNLLHEALALLFDLGLHKAPSRNPKALDIDEQSMNKCHGVQLNRGRTLEERRAALGCFFLVSGCASYFQNIESMRWSPYLEECLEQLQKFNEYDTDQSLIKYVRMQHMIEKINSSPWHDGTDQSSGWKLYPPTLYIRALQRELQTLKKDLQTQFPHNSALFSQYYNVEMTLYEMGLSKSRNPETADPSDFQRLEVLYACLEAVMNFFENFLDIPPGSYWNFSLIHFSHLAHALGVLQRLTFFEDQTWDLHYVSEKLSFTRIIDQLCERVEEAQSYGGTEPSNNPESNNVFAHAASKLRKLNAIFEAQFASINSTINQIGSLDTGDMMNLDNAVGSWEQDWFDIVGHNFGL
ncbi:hypothetical protein F5884DRAFT_788514 [Xylogone sp. PMI_703]|nr:hypothetical protein F5884DRAFT_788514 [Xylogone sp. PMI_703]